MNPEDLAEVETVIAAYFKHKTKKEILDRKMALYDAILDAYDNNEANAARRLAKKLAIYISSSLLDKLEDLLIFFYNSDDRDSRMGEVKIFVDFLQEEIRKELGLE